MANLDNQRWQQILRRQSAANLKRWLAQVKDSDNPARLIHEEYENVLRALEAGLQDEASLPDALQLIDVLHPIVLDFADWNRWLAYLKQALSLVQNTADRAQEAKLLVCEGEVMLRLGLFEETEAAYRDSMAIFESIGEEANYARTLSKLAVMVSVKGNAEEGLALCQAALEQGVRLGDEVGVAQINLNLSYLYNRLRNWEASITAAQEALALFEQHGRLKEATKALINIVATAAEMGDWEQVAGRSENLMETLLAQGDIRTLSQLKNNLGIVAFNQNKLETAESLWHESLLLHSQIQEPVELAGLYNNLGMVYAKMQEWSEAQGMLGKAVESFASLGDLFNWANSLDNLADVYEGLGNVTAAREALQTAVSGLADVGDVQHAQQLKEDIEARLVQLPPQ